MKKFELPPDPEDNLLRGFFPATAEGIADDKETFKMMSDDIDYAKAYSLLRAYMRIERRIGIWENRKERFNYWFTSTIGSARHQQNHLRKLLSVYLTGTKKKSESFPVGKLQFRTFKKVPLLDEADYATLMELSAKYNVDPVTKVETKPDKKRLRAIALAGEMEEAPIEEETKFYIDVSDGLAMDEAIAGVDPEEEDLPF